MEIPDCPFFYNFCNLACQLRRCELDCKRELDSRENSDQRDAPNPHGIDWNKNGVISGMDDEFIELFNSGNEPVDVNGYNITDRSLGYYYKIPDGTTIKPGGFWVVFSGDSNVFQANAGDLVKLFIHQETWWMKGVQRHNSKCLLREDPDGGNWTTSRTPTPGMPNH